MVIRELGLLHFRNYDQLFARFTDRLNVFLGRNGQGKTNLLEALYLTTHLESFRTRKLQPLIETGQPLAQVQAVVLKCDRSYKARFELSRQGKKVWLDEVTVPRVSSYIALFFSLLFNPDHLFHFRQFPAERRAALDRFLAFVDPAYLQALKDMRVVLMQKNKLLKSGRGEGLPEWNHLFIEKGYAILEGRKRMVDQLQARLRGLFGRLTGREEELTLAYRPSLEGTREDWARALERVESRERQAGHALIGPHRDEFRLALEPLAGGRREDEQFSQGEFRGAYLALLFAMNAWLDAERGFRPVLILDDLLSELDPAIQASLMEYLSALPNQIFITTTHWTEGFRPAAAGQEISLREISGGRIL